MLIITRISGVVAKMTMDLHIHSIASGHAVNTIDEIVSYSKGLGIKFLGIVEHGPSMEGAPHEGYFWVSKKIPREIDGMRIFMGIEANIIDTYGSLDVSPETLEEQSIVLAGIHQRTPYIHTMENNIFNNTTAIISAIHSGFCNIIAHPIVSHFPVDIQAIIEESIKKNVLLELNCQIFDNMDKKTLSEYKTMIKILREKKKYIVISSDAHYKNQIGNFNSVLKYKNELGLTDDMIINYKPEMIREYVK